MRLRYAKGNYGLGFAVFIAIFTRYLYKV